MCLALVCDIRSNLVAKIQNGLYISTIQKASKARLGSPTNNPGINFAPLRLNRFTYFIRIPAQFEFGRKQATVITNLRIIRRYKLGIGLLALIALNSGTSIGCSGSMGMGGGQGRSIDAGPREAVSDEFLSDVDIATFLPRGQPTQPVITAEMIQKTLDSIRTADDPDGAKFFAKTNKLPTERYLTYLYENLTNDPVEILGYQFENLRDAALAAEGDLQKITDHYPTIGEFREATGVHSPSDVHLERVENFVALVSESAALSQQDDSTSSIIAIQADQSIASLFELRKEQGLNLFIAQDWVMLPSRILGACGPAMFGVAGTQMAGQGSPMAGSAMGQTQQSGQLGLKGWIIPDGEDFANIFAANCSAIASTVSAAKQASAASQGGGGARGGG